MLPNPGGGATLSTRRADEGADFLGQTIQAYLDQPAAPSLDSIDRALRDNLGRGLDALMLDLHTAALLKDYPDADPRWRLDWVGDYEAGAADHFACLVLPAGACPFAPPSPPIAQIKAAGKFPVQPDLVSPAFPSDRPPSRPSRAGRLRALHRLRGADAGALRSRPHGVERAGALPAALRRHVPLGGARCRPRLAARAAHAAQGHAAALPDLHRRRHRPAGAPCRLCGRSRRRRSRRHRALRAEPRRRGRRGAAHRSQRRRGPRRGEQRRRGEPLHLEDGRRQAAGGDRRPDGVASRGGGAPRTARRDATLPRPAGGGRRGGRAALGRRRHDRGAQRSGLRRSRGAGVRARQRHRFLRLGSGRRALLGHRPPAGCLLHGARHHARPRRRHQRSGAAAHRGDARRMRSRSRRRRRW